MFARLMPLLLCALTGLAACTAAASVRAVDPAPAETPVPPAPAWAAGLAALYDAELRVDGLESRTFSAEAWWQVAMPLLAEGSGFTFEEIGRSAEGRPLRHVAWGEGDTRVLLWSQMHGDESTASMALADLFHFLGAYPGHPLVEKLRAATSLHFFPVVNPDGAARFQRRNAQGVDINRDGRALATPEGRALKALRDRIDPRFGFNLHDQQPGYRVGDSDRGTAIALLAPAFDEARSVNEVRARAIEVAAAIRIALEPHIGGHMARWDDTFNPRAFGDLMTAWGTSTVLIESGGIEGDPEKQALRRLNFIALTAALDAIADGSHAGLPRALYTDLPENGRVFPDLLVRGGTVALPGLPPLRADVLVSFRHSLAGRDGRIVDIGDLGDVRARQVVDATGLYLVPMAGDGDGGIEVGSAARFHLARDAAGSDVTWTLDRDLPR